MPTLRSLRIGSRGSKLALWQAGHIRERLLHAAGVPIEIIIIKTSGDQFASAPVSQIGGKGIFIKEIEEALLDGRIDLAVHSMKDVPTDLGAGLEIAAVTRREDPRDCLIARIGATLESLPQGARVGTGSLRRQSQLRHFRPDLDLRDLRGNVDTRLRKLDAGEYDAIVLAKAGLDRLGIGERITEVISPEVILPAVGQGALGVEIMRSREKDFPFLDALNDLDTASCVRAERALLAALEGGCQVPLGAWGRVEQGQLVLDACVLSADGSEHLRWRATGAVNDPEALGRSLAQDLIAAGAGRILRLAGRSVGGR
jgi:hydroxymethylbilane synthase